MASLLQNKEEITSNNIETLKVNLITYNNSYGLTQDVVQLRNSLEKIYGKQLEFKFVNFYDYKCLEAHINIFLEIVNPILMKYARYNILIPNQEWYYKTWINYMHMFDLILVKTRYAENIFKTILGDIHDDDGINVNEIVKYIGWCSMDKKMIKQCPKKAKTYLHLCGRSKYKQTQTVINNWKSSYPHITIAYSAKDVNIIEKKQDNITYINERLTDAEVLKLMNENFYHICCSETEGYGHYINEAKSCESFVISTDAPPMNELINEDNKTGLLVKIKAEKDVDMALGKKYIIDDEHFQKVIEKANEMTIAKLNIYGHNARMDFFDKNEEYVSNIKIVFDNIISRFDETETEFNISPLKYLIDCSDEDLPTVSVITLAYNRKKFFKLSLLNFMSINYPKDKLEWIIIDDSRDDEKIGNLIPNMPNIHYYSYDTHMSIGHKRNIGVEKANNSIICFMDDDDYYPPVSVRKRVLSMLSFNKSCATCSSIGCFHINKLISMVNVPPHPLPFEERISEATLAFTKEFWEKQKFNYLSWGGEAKEFMKNREKECIEISWEDVIVSLLHNNNTSTRTTVSEEVNGCHFGFSDKLFLFLTELDKQD